MTYDELIAHFETQAQTADALGLRQSSVSIWKSTGIPRARQCEIEIRTGGALRADLDAVTKPRPKPQSGAPGHAAPVQATPMQRKREMYAAAVGDAVADAMVRPEHGPKADGVMTPGPLPVDAEASRPTPTIAETPEEQAQIDAALAELDPAEREEMRQRIARAASVRVVSPIEARLAAAAGAATSTSRAAAAPKARRVEPWEMSDRTIMQKAVELRISIPNGATFGHIRQLCLQHLARK